VVIDANDGFHMQADHIARMPVAGRRQKPGLVFRGLRKRPDLSSG
jgi:hypothetical protein